MTDEIVKSTPHQIISTFDDAERAARAMAGSGFFQDAKQANQAVVKILAGQELGFGPFASMTGVAIIQGKPAVGANLQAAAVKRTGKYNYRVIEMTNEACELEFYEAGKAVGKSRFDLKDATAAGLSGKDNWKKWPRNMLFARAISNGVKWYAPDIFNGATVYTPDELGASEDQDGNIVDVTPEPTQAKPQPVRPVVTRQQAEPVEPPADDLERDFPPLPETPVADADCTGFITPALCVELKLSQNDFSAKAMLHSLNMTSKTPAAVALPIIRNYRAARDGGMTTVEAAEIALGNK